MEDAGDAGGAEDTTSEDPSASGVADDSESTAEAAFADPGEVADWDEVSQEASGEETDEDSEVEQEASDEEEEEPEEEDEPDDEYPAEVKKLMQKLKLEGKSDAEILHSISKYTWDRMNDASKHAKRSKELEDGLSQRDEEIAALRRELDSRHQEKPQQPEEPKAEELSERAKNLQGRISEYEANQKSLQEAKSKVYKDSEGLKEAIIRAQVRLEDAPEELKEQRRREVAALVREQHAAVDRWEALRDRELSYKEKIADLQDKLEAEQQRLEAQKETEKSQARVTQEFKASQIKSFQSLFETSADEYEIPEEDRARRFKQVRSMIVAELRSRDKNSPAMDLSKAIPEIFQDLYGKSPKQLRSEFTKDGKKKLAVVKTVKPQAGRPTAPRPNGQQPQSQQTAPRKSQDATYRDAGKKAREEARRLLEGRNRR